MSDKEAVIELVKRLPPDVSLREIAHEIQFIAAIQEGFDEIDTGQGIPVRTLLEYFSQYATVTVVCCIFIQ